MRAGARARDRSGADHVGDERPLTLDEIREKGIAIDRDDYLGFQFTLGMQLDSQVVKLDSARRLR